MSLTENAQLLAVDLDSLPSPPSLALEIVRLSNDPDASAADLASVIGQDPVLSARIMKVANSPGYGLAHEVTNVDRAAALLGLKAVKLMALSFSLSADVGDETGALSTETYWYHSLFTAVAGRRWAEIVAPGLTEEAFLVGLLSQLGRLVLAQQKPEEYTALLVSKETDWPSLEAEREAFGSSGAEITSVLLKDWGLPSLIAATPGVAYLGHDPDPAIAGAEELGKVFAGVLLTEQALSTGADEDLLSVLQTALSEAGADVESVDAFVLDLEERIREIADVLDVPLPSDMSHTDLLLKARTQLVEVSLQAVHGLQSAEAQAAELRQSNEELAGKAFTDRLTGVPNRAAFDDHMARVLGSAGRGDIDSVGLIMLDIDHFKSFNDTHGHQVGDDVLAAVAGAMKQVSRRDTLFARYGGEEFSMVLMNCGLSDAVAAGERLRAAVEATIVATSAGLLQVTVSGGAAIVTGNEITPDAAEVLIGRADRALYGAKELGRNRVVGSNECPDLDDLRRAPR